MSLQPDLLSNVYRTFRNGVRAVVDAALPDISPALSTAPPTDVTPPGIWTNPQQPPGCPWPSQPIWDGQRWKCVFIPISPGPPII